MSETCETEGNPTFYSLPGIYASRSSTGWNTTLYDVYLILAIYIFEVSFCLYVDTSLDHICLFEGELLLLLYLMNCLFTFFFYISYAHILLANIKKH